MDLRHQVALRARNDLKKYGVNARLLFALEHRFQLDDIHTVAADALTDEGNDKKCDLVYVDRNLQLAVVAQAYESSKAKPSAPSNKASDLNTAAAWLLTRRFKDLPKGLQPAAAELRSALESNSIKALQFWYVHNLPESKNVREELVSVEATAGNAIRTQFHQAEVLEISAIEVGLSTLEEWYLSIQAPILVKDTFRVPISGSFRENGDDWEAIVTSVPARWLQKLYREHQTKLFSANLRGYLGSRQADSNINNGIKKTAENEPANFWVFNNGITGLVHDAQVNGEGTELTLSGLSIVNGAQTTGAVGSLSGNAKTAVRVQARFVKCSDYGTVREIIKFNNSQNKLEAADFRSNDTVQKRLCQEFSRIPDALYLGGRRGGSEDLIKRPANLLPNDTCAQALAIFHQQPEVAYNQRSEIWISDSLYSKFFSEQTHAVHIVFAYALLKSIEAKKLALKQRKLEELTKVEIDQLDFLRQRGSTFLLPAAIAACIETLVGYPVPNPFRLSFGPSASPHKACTYWGPIVDATIPFCGHLRPALSGGLNNPEQARAAIVNFRSMVEATKIANMQIFKTFGAKVRLNKD